jgi:hypothetical protein
VPRRSPLLLALLAAACSGEVSSARDAGDASAIADANASDDAGMDAGAEASARTDAGAASDGGIAKDTRPRLGSIAPTTWIFASRARKKNGKLGYLRPGTSVALKDPAPIEDKKRRGECKSGRWYAVEPTGYVCEDETTTRDLESPLFRALASAAPRDAARPYDWAFSTRAPMYPRLPSASEQKKAEKRLRPIAELGKIPRSTAGHEDLALLAPPPARDPRPDFFDAAPAPAGKKRAGARREIPYGSMLPPLQVQYCCPLYAELAQLQLTAADLHTSLVPTGFDWQPFGQVCSTATPFWHS